MTHFVMIISKHLFNLEINRPSYWQLKKVLLNLPSCALHEAIELWYV